MQFTKWSRPALGLSRCFALAVSTHLAVSSAYSCSREARQRVEERRGMRVIFMVCVSRWRVAGGPGHYQLLTTDPE